jgi:putative salt-induced outer membrane protein YdiY
LKTTPRFIRFGVAAALFVGPAASGQAAAPKTAFTGDLGFVSATGNTRLTTLSVGEKLIHTNGRWVLTQLAAYVYGKTNAVESANQLRLGARADLAFMPRLGTFAGVTFERNTYAGFNSRTDEFAGLRWLAIVAPMDSMSIDGGGGFTQKDNVDGTSENDPSARVAANYKHLFSKAAYFQQVGEYIPNLGSTGGYRANSESALVAPISTHAGIKMSYTVRHDSKPPATFGKTDRVLTMGVQLTY